MMLIQCALSVQCSVIQNGRYLHICVFAIVASTTLPTNKYVWHLCVYAVCERNECLLYCVCICGLLLEKGLQVSNLIEIIPLK